MNTNHSANLDAVRESVAYRSPIREEKIIRNEKYLPIIASSDSDRVRSIISGGIDSILILSRLSQTEKEITAFYMRAQARGWEHSSRIVKKPTLRSDSMVVINNLLGKRGIDVRGLSWEE